MPNISASEIPHLDRQVIAELRMEAALERVDGERLTAEGSKAEGRHLVLLADERQRICDYWETVCDDVDAGLNPTFDPTKVISPELRQEVEAAIRAIARVVAEVRPVLMHGADAFERFSRAVSGGWCDVTDEMMSACVDLADVGLLAELADRLGCAAKAVCDPYQDSEYRPIETERAKAALLLRGQLDIRSP
jgi:hypothetical protein